MAKNIKNLKQALPFILIIGGLIGFVASSILTIDKIHLLKNPDFDPSCNLSPLISCGSVMQSLQAEVFGFPNSLIGMVSFATIITIGMALLAGAKFRRWFWLGLQAGATFGVGFVHWLFFQSVYKIDALCIYCMVVWSVTIPIFWYTTLYNLREGHISTPPSLKGFVAFLQRHHGDILAVWLLTIAGLIINRFWYYWQTLI